MTLSELLDAIDKGTWFDREKLIDALRDAYTEIQDLRAAPPAKEFVQLGLDSGDYLFPGMRGVFEPKKRHPLYDKD